MELGAKMRLIPTKRFDPEDDGEVSPYRGLIYNVFQMPREAQRGLAIAVTAAHAGAGTTYVVSSLAAELGTYPANSILQVDLPALAGALHSGEDVLRMAAPTSHPGIHEICPKTETRSEERSSGYWHASAEHRKACIDHLRGQFQYVLFDCPPVLASSDALGIASLVDGLLLVVEADRTTKKEIFRAEHQIEVAGGRLYGSVLNKRKPPILDRAQRRL